MDLGFKKRFFYIFIILHAIFWTILQAFRHVMSIDAMEAVTWGELISLGTNKHPPLTGWLSASLYNFFGNHEIAIYILGQLCVILGFIYVYKLAKNFIDEEKAFCSVMILEACHYYTYSVFLDNFNCNIILLAFFPIVAYYFYKGIKDGKVRDWICFGFASGLAFLGKYQIVFLLFALFVYLLIDKREQFRKKGIYIAFLTGFLTILPHLIWMYRHDFFCLAYMFERAESADIQISLAKLIFNRILYPLKFLADQILAVLGCVAMYLITAFYAKNINFKTDSLAKSDRIFILTIALVPILAQAFVGIITGSRVPGTWGSMMMSFTGILLFSFFPINFSQNTFKFFAKLSGFVLFGALIAVFIFLNTQKKLFISLPYEKIFNDLNKQWSLATNNAKLKYVAGDLGYIFAYRYYNNEHPHVILDTFGYKNPWENHDDIINSGAIIFSDEEDDLDKITKDRIIMLPKDYEVNKQEYNYEICNKFKSCKEYTFYYTIIPPKI